MIKSECEVSGLKQALSHMSDKVGSLVSSSCLVQLQHNERQVKYMDMKSVVKSSEYSPMDELYSVMFQAKHEDLSSKFVEDIKVLPEPAVVLASGYQLNDLVLFGTR